MIFQYCCSLEVHMLLTNLSCSQAEFLDNHVFCTSDPLCYLPFMSGFQDMPWALGELL